MGEFWMVSQFRKVLPQSMEGSARGIMIWVDSLGAKCTNLAGGIFFGRESIFVFYGGGRIGVIGWVGLFVVEESFIFVRVVVCRSFRGSIRMLPDFYCWRQVCFLLHADDGEFFHGKLFSGKFKNLKNFGKISGKFNPTREGKKKVEKREILKGVSFSIFEGVRVKWSFLKCGKVCLY